MAVLKMSIVLWLIFTVNCLSKHIPPTYSNTTGEYYISSASKMKFQNNTIQCNASNCYILCDTANGCYQTLINATKSTNLNLTCTALSSCNSTYLIEGPTNSANIYCNNKTACASSTINVNKTTNVTIQCNSNSPPQFTDDNLRNSACMYAHIYANFSKNVDVKANNIDCLHTKFYVTHSDYATFKFFYYTAYEAFINGSSITKSLSVTCETSESCWWTTIICPYDANCNVYCNGYGSCTDTRIKIKDVNYDYLNLNCYEPENTCDALTFWCMNNGRQTTLYDDSKTNTYQCGGWGCCPWSNGNITCIRTSNQSNDECVIDCSKQLCTNKYIYGLNASSLTVVCNGTLEDPMGYSCAGAHIVCPNTDNSSCAVICVGQYSCRDVIVNVTANIMNRLNVVCNNSISDDCWYLSIVTNNNTDAINSVSIDCTGQANCWHSQFNFDNVAIINDLLNITCNGKESCQYATITGTNNYISSMSLLCEGDKGCQSMVVKDVFIRDNISITCTEIDTCTNTVFGCDLLPHASEHIFINDRNSTGTVCTTNSPTSTPSMSPTISPTLSPTRTPTGSSSNVKTDETGVIIGVTVGVVFICIILVVLLRVYFKRKTKRENNETLLGAPINDD